MFNTGFGKVGSITFSIDGLFYCSIYRMMTIDDDSLNNIPEAIPIDMTT